MKRFDWLRTKASGTNAIMGLGVVLTSFIVAPVAMDIPTYYAVQQEMQTAIDAAALAGASKLPSGVAAAKAEALKIAALNPIMGKTLTANDLTISASGSTFGISGKLMMPTITTKIMCGLQGTLQKDPETQETELTADSYGFCQDMAVSAKATANPAARDTILVIDTSSSMNDLGGGQPFGYVKSASNAYLDQVVSLNSASVDRVGIVTFDQTGKLRKTLTSLQESANFSSLRTTLTGLQLFSGSGWNTNYEAGLKAALDELQSKGRNSSNKQIIFLTDGLPNLPAPANYYTYSQSEPYRKCTDIVHNSSAVKALCYWKNGQKICPSLPSASITDAMISSSAVQCGTDYVNTMLSMTNSQADRAKAMGVKVYTISIRNTSQPDNANDILRRLIKKPSWEPTQLAYMASTTGGIEYTAPSYNATAIQNIYKQIAQALRIRLASS